MNANLLRPCLNTLLACSALAAVTSLHAEDRNGHPRFVQSVYRSAYPAPAAPAPATVTIAYTAPVSSAPVTATEPPVIVTERRALQRLEIPIGFNGPRASASMTTSNLSFRPNEIAPVVTANAQPSTEAQTQAPVEPPKEAVKRLPELDVAKLPFATLSNKRGFVKSPYEPFNELDATGLSSGMLAKDPTTGKIFRLP